VSLKKINIAFKFITEGFAETLAWKQAGRKVKVNQNGKKMVHNCYSNLTKINITYRSLVIIFAKDENTLSTSAFEMGSTIPISTNWRML
jgi:hypothetical protein